jgi:putative oxidoreductase
VQEVGVQTLEKLKPLALLLLRLALGAIFIHYGYPKLFVHTRESMQWFAQHGFPSYFALISGVLEVFGGFLIIIGLFTRIAGLLLAGEMAVALWRVHGFFSHPLAVPNYQFPLMMFVGSFALAALGAGLLSFDQPIFERRGGAPRKSKSKP